MMFDSIQSLRDFLEIPDSCPISDSEFQNINTALDSNLDGNYMVKLNRELYNHLCKWL